MPLDKVWQMHGSGYLFIMKKSFVYLMSLGFNNFYKIGIADNVGRRRKSLAAANPMIKVVCSFEVDNADIHEEYLHNFFSYERVEREIFELRSIDVDFVISYFKKRFPKVVYARLKERELMKKGKYRELISFRKKNQSLLDFRRMKRQ